jgi:hypothetical protein
MGRKLRSMFPSVTPRPGSGEVPRPLPGRAVLDGTVDGTVREEVPPVGSMAEPQEGLVHDDVARLAYLRWLEVGGSSVDNWLWAEAELKRRDELSASGGD